MDDIQVRFWAAARAAAGTAETSVPVSRELSMSDLVKHLGTTHGDGRLSVILPLCAVLVDDRPLGRRDPAEVLVRPGSRVEFLPPFAGG